LSAKLRHLIETNQLNEANNLVDSILQSADRSIEVKFDTIIRHEEIWARSHRNQVTIIDRANFDIKQALQLKELCNSHDNIVAELKVLERGYFLTAKFNFLAVRDYQLQRNSVIAWEHDLEGPSWFIDLHEERKKSAKITGSAFGEIIEYISKLASDQYWQFIPEFVTRAAQSIIFILQRLKAEGLLDGPEGIEKWFDIALDFVLRLIGGLNAILRIDVYHLKCATLYIQFLAVFYDDPEKQSLNLTKTKQIISQIEDSNSQTEAHRMLDKTIALCESENVA